MAGAARLRSHDGLLAAFRPALLAAGAAALTALGALALHQFEFAAAHGAVLGLLLAGAVLAPRACSVFILVALIAIEPGAFDFTEPLSVALYDFPEGVRALLPLEMSPVEAVALVCLAALLFRRNPRGRLWAATPRLLLAFPVVMALGLAYGLATGGDPAIAYHEMRGLIFATVAFALAIEVTASRGNTDRRIVPALLVASAVLALLLVARYFFYLRSGDYPVPPEFAYAHEGVLLLGAGLAIAAIEFVRREALAARGLLLVHALLMVAATMVTGRRLGTLVLLVIALALLALLVRRRPIPGLVASAVLAVLLAGYLGIYWDQTYGAMAQPARAIRSQFDPTLRDASSDTYREFERVSIQVTIDSSPFMGVGFGRPFYDLGVLPSLESWWPLQFYTPHQNLLWLWLKMGIVGAAVFLGVWVIAAGRAARAAFAGAGHGPLPALAMVLLPVLTAYLAFATYDVTFSSTRAAAPFGIALALALTRLPPWSSGPQVRSTSRKVRPA